jgi:hypothetical protein
MTSQYGDQIVGGYLRRLKDELGTLPAPQRDEVMADLAGHLTESRAFLKDETDAEVLNILDRLGEPAEIAADARLRFGLPEPVAVGPLEIAALLAIAVGTVAVPWLPIGLAVGTALVWRSRCWSPAAKRTGAYTPLVTALVVLAACALFAGLLGAAALIGAALAGMVLPLVSAGYLTWKLGRRLQPLAAVAMAVVFLVALVPAVIGVIPPAATARIGGEAGPRPVTSGGVTCGAFYGGEHYRFHGTAGISVGVCWNGTSTWTDWGPNCPIESYGLARLTVHTCTAHRQSGDSALEIDLSVSHTAMTSPFTGNSVDRSWIITPDGALH